MADAMGSTTALSSTAGAVVERYVYQAFGADEVKDATFGARTSSSYDWETRHHGELQDEETSYYNYGYRYYIPHLGRWPSRDPIGEEGGLNLYGFIRNCPYNNHDYYGLTTLEGFARSTTPRWLQDLFDERTIPDAVRPDSNIPNPTEHLGLSDVGDQTSWFDKRYPNIIEQAKLRVQPHIRNKYEVAICDKARTPSRLNQYIKVEGHVIYSVVPRNWRLPFFDFSALEDKYNNMVFDDLFGDKAQSPLSAALSLGKFWFRVAPMRMEIRRGEKFLRHGKCCRRIHYTAKLQLRDALGVPKMSKNRTRGSWKVEGSVECCHRVKH